MNKQINLFLEKYQNENTKRSYKQGLKLFFNFLKENNLSLEELNENVIIKYQNLLAETFSVDSQRHNLVLLKNFFNFLMKLNYIKKNYFYVINLPKAQRESKTKYIQKEKIEKLLTHLKNIAYAVNDETKYKNIVFYIAFYFFVYHGLRISEVVKLKLKNIVFDADIPYIRIMGKGNVIREHPLKKEFIPILKKYINAFKINEYLFKSIYGENKHISIPTIYRKIVKLGKNVIKEKIHPHQIRHFCITQCLENGFDINEVRHFAGHKSIETTIRYDRRQKTLQSSPILKLNFLTE